MAVYTKNIRSILLVCSLSLGGCATHSGLQSPEPLIQEELKLNEQQKWQHANADQVTALGQAGWLNDLNDPRLIAWTDTALQRNYQLRANAASLEANIQAARINNQQLYPNLDFRLNRTKTEIDNSGSRSYTSTYNGNFNISWELDIWRKLSNQKKSSVLSAQATAANYQAARLALVANVSKSWFSANSLKLRIDLAKRRLQSQQSTLSVIEDQYKNGNLSARDVYLSRTDIETQKSSILDLEQTLDNSLRTFKQLLGSYPNIDVDFDATLPDLNSDIPSGLPSEIMERRPDIMASRLEWESARYNAKAAFKSRFPSFSLTASYGASSNELSQLDQQSLLWNFVSNLTLPLFRGGALKAQSEQAASQAEALLYTYIDTLLTSFNEVETALSNEQRLKQRLDAITQAAFYAESGYELALEQYKSGLITYSTMLDSQRRWFDAESNVISLRNSLLQNRIDLHLALGGDFQAKAKTDKNKP